MYKLYALKYATSQTRLRQQNFLDPVEELAEEENRLDLFIWIAVGEGRAIVIDTGCDSETATSRGYQFLRCPAGSLQLLGLNAGRVDTVISTHLHWDHAGNYEKFPNAKVHAQSCEAQFAFGPCMCQMNLRRVYDERQLFSFVGALHHGRVEFTDGDREVAPGICVHLIGGHTAGMQAVSVQTSRGRVLIASDATHLFANFRRRNPFPALYDRQQYMAGLDRLLTLSEGLDMLIPGHDPLIMKAYRAPSADLEGVAVALHEPPSISLA